MSKGFLAVDLDGEIRWALAHPLPRVITDSAGVATAGTHVT